ncbi:FCD domain-containing protein, partial [Burkholderia cepacia]
ALGVTLLDRNTKPPRPTDIGRQVFDQCRAILREVDALRESVRRGDDAWERRVRQSFEMLSAWEQPVSIEHRTAWESCNRRFHEALISAAATPWTYLILRMLSQQSERYRRVCIGLGDSKRDVHAEHMCLFDAAMRRAD